MNNPLFSVLICSLERRKHYLDRLKAVLSPQKTKEVEFLVSIDNGENSVGTKRNQLLQQAKGDYIAYVDDDDLVMPNYVELIVQAIKSSHPDVIGIHLLHKEDGILRGLTYHSLKYQTWSNEKVGDMMHYYRNPNHINPVKRELALKVKFPDTNMCEDRVYSANLLPYLKSEVYIKDPIYEYLVRTHKEV